LDNQMAERDSGISAARGLAAGLGHFLVGKEESTAVRDRLLQGASGMLGLRIAFSGLSFLVTLLLARLLGAARFGAYSYAFAWVVLLGVPAILGMDQLLVREVAAYQTKAQWRRLRGLVERANQAVLLASCGIGALAAATVWLLRARVAAQVLPTFWVALLLLPLIALTRVRQGVMQGLHRVALGALPELLLQPALLVLFLAVAWLWRGGLTAPLAMTLNVAATLAAFLTGALLLRRTLPLPVREAAPAYDNLTWAKSALPLLFVAGAGILFGQADTLILGAVRGTGAVGTYTIAHKGADLITFVLMAQNAAFASTAASLYASRELARLQRLVTKLARWTLLFSAPVAAVLIVFGDLFLRFYGAQFAAARVPLAILSFGQLVNVGMGSVGLLLIMAGHERQAARAVAAAAIANIVLTAALAPRWGAEGASVAYAASMILWNIWMAIALYRKVGIHSTALGVLSPPPPV
jgi:O-antigen/teichoic acid export membrane protein